MFFGLLGSGHLCFFRGPQNGQKMPKNRIWGPVEAVSANFSGDLKVAHGDSATDEPGNFGFRIDVPEIGLMVGGGRGVSPSSHPDK